MSRKLNSDEIDLINSDLKPFEKILILNNLLSEKVKNKYVNISFHIENKQEIGGANGIAYINSKTGRRDIGVLDSVMTNEEARTRVVYHELGHGLMGMKTYATTDATEKIIKPIVETRRSDSTRFSLELDTYLSGFRCLEEYLVEKFSQRMAFLCKGLQVPSKQHDYCPTVSGNYTYWNTFGNKYGMFETICDKLIGKCYGNLDGAIRSGLNEEFFGTFFEKFDRMEMMELLGKLGKVYEAIMVSSSRDKQQNRKWSQEEVEKSLISARDIVNSMCVQNNRTNENNNTSHRR